MILWEKNGINKEVCDIESNHKKDKNEKGDDNNIKILKTYF